LAVRKQEMVSYAPVTSQHVAEGSMTVRELCAATATISDNAAANILLQPLGGPAAPTQFMRDIGDPVTRLDRMEVELNTNLPGDLRDTTRPARPQRCGKRSAGGVTARPLSGDRGGSYE
jgi:beta-lactamase class A